MSFINLVVNGLVTVLVWSDIELMFLRKCLLGNEELEVILICKNFYEDFYDEM